MTNKELSRWLREKPTRECTHRNDTDDRLVYSIHTYLEICANEEVDDCILIREDDSDWREPLVEVTDEEMAEKYRKSLKQKLIDEDEFERLEMFDENVEEAYLAGLKAGRPQWHDLRKDPNDLPKEDYEIITLHENGNKNIQNWKNGNWTNAIVIPVIAWCEIPTFTDNLECGKKLEE